MKFWLILEEVPSYPSFEDARRIGETRTGLGARNVQRPEEVRVAVEAAFPSARCYPPIERCAEIAKARREGRATWCSVYTSPNRKGISRCGANMELWTIVKPGVGK